jgi:hypothetical protein
MGILVAVKRKTGSECGDLEDKGGLLIALRESRQ